MTAHNVALNSCLVKTARHKVTSEGSLSVVALSTELRTLGIKDFHDWQKQKGTLDLKGQLTLEMALNFD